MLFFNAHRYSFVIAWFWFIIILQVMKMIQYDMSKVWWLLYSKRFS